MHVRLPRYAAVLVCSLPLAACGSGDDGDQLLSPASPCSSGDLTVTADGVAFTAPCEGTAMGLYPSVMIGGAWHGAGRDGACTAGGTTLVCPAGEAGTVSAEVIGATARVLFSASGNVQVQALALEGNVVLPGARAWLSNGFQSWSQTGVLALGPQPGDEALAKALSARGDAEVDRYGNELSWWYSFAGGGDFSLFAGALTGDRFKPWIQMSRDADGPVLVRLVSGGAGENVSAVAGEQVQGELFMLGLGNALNSTLTTWGQSIPSRRSAHPIDPVFGWNSWYELWDKVDEQAVRQNADLVKETFAWSAARPFYIVVDDGWQQKWGEWQPNDKFPSGISGLAADLHAQGFKAGVWIAPFLVEEGSALVTDHPDWFVQDAVYNHSLHGPMRILDVTNPDAAQHLREVISTLVSWGLDFLKIDFLFAATYEGQRAGAVTGMEAYAKGLQLIREAAGPETIIISVGAPPVATFPYVDGWRLGGDIAFEPFGPSWYFLINQARSLAARWPLCEATLCDADPPLLRTLPDNEVNVGVWVALAARGVVFLSDDLRKLPQERLHWALTDEQARALQAGEGRAPRSMYPDSLPQTLTNAVIDQVARKSQHAIPAVWDSAHGVSDTQLTINFTDDPLPEGYRPVAPHTAEEWRVPMIE